MKKHKKNIELNVFSDGSKKSQYTNIIDRDPNKIAQIILDLIILGFPMEKAMKIATAKIRKGDWMGI